jgi:hypothetical protein
MRCSGKVIVIGDMVFSTRGCDVLRGRVNEDAKNLLSAKSMQEHCRT